MLAALVWRARRATRGDEADRIAAQYVDLMLTAHVLQPPAGMSMICVDAFEDLAHIARQRAIPVIRLAGAPQHFMALTPEATYYFNALPAGSGPAGAAAAPARTRDDAPTGASEPAPRALRPADLERLATRFRGRGRFSRVVTGEQPVLGAVDDHAATPDEAQSV